MKRKYLIVMYLYGLIINFAQNGHFKYKKGA